MTYIALDKILYNNYYVFILCIGIVRPVPYIGKFSCKAPLCNIFGYKIYFKNENFVVKLIHMENLGVIARN